MSVQPSTQPGAASPRAHPPSLGTRPCVGGWGLGSTAGGGRHRVPGSSPRPPNSAADGTVAALRHPSCRARPPTRTGLRPGRPASLPHSDTGSPRPVTPTPAPGAAEMPAPAASSATYPGCRGAALWQDRMGRGRGTDGQTHRNRAGHREGDGRAAPSARGRGPAGPLHFAPPLTGFA